MSELLARMDTIPTVEHSSIAITAKEHTPLNIAGKQNRHSMGTDGCRQTVLQVAQCQVPATIDTRVSMQPLTTATVR